MRGGPEVLAYSGGPVITQATVTGVAGFGSTERYERNRGLVETLTVGAGGDARNGGAAVSLLGGLEWFDVPETTRRRWGYRVGLDAGWRWRGPELSVGELLAQVRGGPVLRLRPREYTSDLLLTLGLEATLGMAGVIDDAPGNETVSFVGGLAVTVGATRVAPFHL